jgi:hypothetical protein
MATNPPIVIGPFANVPAPGSGVKSDWAQQISHYVTDNVPRGLVVRPAQVLADQATVNAEVDITGMTNTITVVAGRWYEVSFRLCTLQGGGQGNQNIYLNLDGDNRPVAIVSVPANFISTFAGSLVFSGGAAIAGLPSIAAGAGKIVKMRASSGGSGFIPKHVYASGMLAVKDIGSTVAAP